MENGENTLTSEWYTYEGESSSGKPHGVGKVQSKNGSSYDGKFSNGEFNGKGVLTFPDGSSYDGKFCDGEFLSGKIKTTGTDGKPLEKDFTSDFVKGEGIWANPDGLTYIGEFSSRDPNGKGMLIHPDGNVYEGEFSNGELSGKGIFKYSNGDVYEGEFSDGSLSGTGKITCGDTGESFKGEFKNSAPWEGDGTFRDPDGNIFTGKILWGVPWKGNGTFRYPNGNTFEGRFENSRPSGEGTFKLHDGEEKYAIEFKNNGDSWVHLGNSRKFVNALDLSTYEGDLPNGLPRGKGKQEYKNGDFLEGTFENGEFIKGAGKITDSNGKIVYEGELEGPNIRANGHGKRVYKNGDFMKGAFKSGKFIKGTGRITIDDGKEEIVYEGEFSNESLQGKGRKEYKNGEFLDGIFEDGEFVSGTGKITIDDGKEEIVYEGELEGPDDIKTSGHGKIVYKNGDFLEGTFKNGEFIKGTGKTTSYDGKTIYKGGLEGPNKKASGYGRRITDWGSSKVIEEGMFEQGKPRKTISKSSGGGSLHYREYDDSGQPILFRGLDGNLLKSSDGRLLLEKMSEKPLYSTEYERGERKSTLYYSYRDDGTVERVIEINFRRINELLNRGISDPEELVTSGAIRDVTEGVIPLITYNDIRIHIQRCSSQILKNKAKLSGDGFFGGTPEERNIIVLANVDSLDVLKRIRFEVDNIARNHTVISLLSSLGINSTNIDSLGDYISTTINVNPDDSESTVANHVVSVTFDLKRIRAIGWNNIDESNEILVYGYDSASHNKFGGMENNTGVMNYAQQRGGTCWLNASCLVLAVAKNTELVNKMRDGDIELYRANEMGADKKFPEGTPPNYAMIEQMEQMEEVAMKAKIDTANGKKVFIVNYTVADEVVDETRKYASNEALLNLYDERVGAVREKFRELSRENFDRIAGQSREVFSQKIGETVNPERFTNRILSSENGDEAKREQEFLVGLKGLREMNLCQYGLGIRLKREQNFLEQSRESLEKGQNTELALENLSGGTTVGLVSFGNLESATGDLAETLDRDRNLLSSSYGKSEM